MSAEQGFLYAGIGLCLLGLLAMARHDWIRLTRRTRHATAEVCSHKTSRDDEGLGYFATYRFLDDAGSHEVTDSLRHQTPLPPLGTRVALSYPAGRPDLARPRRSLQWLSIYSFLLTMAGLLAARALGLLVG